MLTLYLKEIRSFLSSLVGYIAIGVFISLIGIFMWVLPADGGGYNVLDNGFANIDPPSEPSPPKPAMIPATAGESPRSRTAYSI